jgi:AraC family transcriptional regulator
MIHDSCDPVSLSQLAIDLGIHPVHFSRTFKKFYLYSPSEYQQKLLISRALCSLKHGFSLNDCAAEVGYADQSHMTRAFNKHLGLAPNKLRNLFIA